MSIALRNHSVIFLTVAFLGFGPSATAVLACADRALPETVDRLKDSFRTLATQVQEDISGLSPERRLAVQRFMNVYFEAQLMENVHFPNTPEWNRAKAVLTELTEARQLLDSGKLRNPMVLHNVAEAAEAALHGPNARADLNRLRGTLWELVDQLIQSQSPAKGGRALSRTEVETMIAQRRADARAEFPAAPLSSSPLILDTNIAMRVHAVRRDRRGAPTPAAHIPGLNARGGFVTETGASELVNPSSPVRGTRASLRQATIPDSVRQSPLFARILTTLERALVGAPKGFQDRHIITEALLLQTRREPPQFLSRDRDVYSRLARFAVDPAVRGLTEAQLMQRYGATWGEPTQNRGFEIEIEGRRLRIVPFNTRD
jgi:hypothetical protein